MANIKLTDNERQMLQNIANRCNEASDEIAEKDKDLTSILNECDRLADMIDTYLERNN